MGVGTGGGAAPQAPLTALSKMSPIWLIDPCIPTTAVAGVSLEAHAVLVMGEFPLLVTWLLALVTCADHVFFADGPRADSSVLDAMGDEYD